MTAVPATNAPVFKSRTPHSTVCAATTGSLYLRSMSCRRLAPYRPAIMLFLYASAYSASDTRSMVCVCPRCFFCHSARSRRAGVFVPAFGYIAGEECKAVNLRRFFGHGKPSSRFGGARDATPHHQAVIGKRAAAKRGYVGLLVADMLLKAQGPQRPPQSPPGESFGVADGRDVGLVPVLRPGLGW